MEQYKRKFKEDEIQVTKDKKFIYDLHKIKTDAHELAQRMIKGKGWTVESVFPDAIEIILREMVKEQFNYDRTKIPSYAIMKPIIKHIGSQLGITFLGY